MKKALTAVVATALSASIAVAAPHGGKHGRKDFESRSNEGARAERMQRDLQLTDAQKHQIRDLRKRFHAENKDLQDRMKRTRRDYVEARKANDPRADQLRAELERQKEILRNRRIEQRRQMLSLLTPEQRARVEAKERDRMDRRADRDGDRFDRDDDRFDREDDDDDDGRDTREKREKREKRNGRF